MDLQKILSQVKKEDFLSVNWLQEPLYISTGENFDDIISVALINQFLQEENLLYPFLRVINKGNELSLEEYSAKHNYLNILNRNKVFDLFDNGATIVIQGAQYLFKNLEILSQNLTEELKSTINCNIYITPKNSQGFFPHFDTHEVIVLQIFGTKRWKLYDQMKKYPMKSWSLDQDEIAKYRSAVALYEMTLFPGDFLYFPAGVVHDAYCEDTVSIHLTIGAHSKSNLDFLRQIVQNAEQIEYFRSPFKKSLEGICTLKACIGKLVDDFVGDFSIVKSSDTGLLVENIFLNYCAVDFLEHVDNIEFDVSEIGEDSLMESETKLYRFLFEKSTTSSTLNGGELLTLFSRETLKSLLKKGAVKLKIAM